MNTLKQSDRTDHQPELVAARSYDSGDETLNFDFTAIYFDSISTAGEDVSVFLADKSPGPRLSLNRSQ